MALDSPQPPLTAMDKLRGLHCIYCEETGNALPLTVHRQDQWALWERHGFTAEDLRLVIRYLRKTFYRKERPEILRAMLHFRKLVEPEHRETGLDYSNFEEYLADARAAQRNARPVPTARSAALEAVGRRDDPPEHQARPVGQIAQDLTEDYRKLKEQAGLL